MRLIHILPLLAALALAACGSDPDDSSEEGLSMEELTGAIQDNGVMPRPGEYSAEYELISVEMENGRVEDMAALEAAFDEGAQEQTSFCVTEAMDRESWISAMTDNSCDISRLAAEGGYLDLTMTCEAEEGPQGRIAMGGAAGPTSSDLQMSFTQPIPGKGDARIVMKVLTQRIGECG